jgi:hypothetical protein
MSYCHLCQDTRKVYATLGGTYSGVGGISDAGNWDNNANLQGRISKDPKRVPLAMNSYVSSLHDATNCLAISEDPVTTTVPPTTSVVATTTTSQATTSTKAPPTTEASPATTTEASPTSTCNRDGICQPDNGENCLNCPDCAGVTNGKPAERYCCGDGTGGTVSCIDDARCTSSGWNCEVIAFGDLFE